MEKEKEKVSIRIDMAHLDPLIRNDLQEARERAILCDEWKVRLEYKDEATNSDKYWEATGKGEFEIRVTYGRMGSSGNILIKNFNYVFSKLPEKVSKGYKIVEFYGERKLFVEETRRLSAKVRLGEMEKLKGLREGEGLSIPPLKRVEEEKKKAGTKSIKKEPPKESKPKSLKEMIQRRKSSSLW